MPATPIFVTAAYGGKYAAFLGPWLHALYETHPTPPQALVMWDDIPQREIAVLAAAYPDAKFVHHAVDKGGDIMHAIPRKLSAWIAAARLAGERPIAFMDVDAVLLRPLDDLFSGTWDVVFTWKDETFPINTGVMLAADGSVAAHLFTAMLARIEALIASKPELAGAIGASGAADQHALREIAGFCNYDGQCTRNVTAGGVTREVRFRGEPCRTLNETACREIDGELRVVHYKTGWHPILLDNAAFTKNRPQAACASMFRHWHELESRSAGHIARSLASHAALAARDRFAGIAGGYEERGILHSEMLAVCGVCERLGVQVIIESGRCRAQSTSILARYFEGTGTSIASIELVRDENADFAEERLAGFPAVELLFGDSFELLPALLAKHAGKRAAILLDGPKGLPAMNLAAQCMREHENVAAAFIHDMRKGTPQRDAAGDFPFRTFFTDDAAYVSRFAELDRECLPPPQGPITMHTWRPFRKGEDQIGSYGPTLAVLLPRPTRLASWNPAAASPAVATAA